MKKWVYVILVLVFCALFLKACVHQDFPNSVPPEIRGKSDVESVVFPPPQKTVSINGVDFLQSQAPVGKFGGELRASTIGEGPKTFNPFNSKDNISSLMSDVMYDRTFCQLTPKQAHQFQNLRNLLP